MPGIGELILRRILFEQSLMDLGNISSPMDHFFVRCVNLCKEFGSLVGTP